MPHRIPKDTAQIPTVFHVKGKKQPTIDAIAVLIRYGIISPVSEIIGMLPSTPTESWSLQFGAS
jgi:hypothetical protein